MPHTLFEQLKQGCPAAFAAIHDRYQRRIFWLGKRLLQDDFVIETLVQDTFLKLWTHRDCIETPNHIYYFLRFVMNRECMSYYTRPKNKFSRSLHSLEGFGQYQDYMAGYDPLLEAEHLEYQQLEQREFDRIQHVLPFLNAESRRLITLCLTYGFHYKAIAEAMGSSVTETSNKIQKAIAEIKTILHRGTVLEAKLAPLTGHGNMTEGQAEVLKRRFEHKQSFAAIATAMDLTEPEVLRAFMTGYKLLQNKQQLELV